MLSNFSMNKVD